MRNKSERIYFHVTDAKVPFKQFNTPEVWFDDAPRDYGTKTVIVRYNWKKPFVTSEQEAEENLELKIPTQEVRRNKRLYVQLGGEINPATFNELRRRGYDVVIDDEGYAALYPERVQILGVAEGWDVMQEELSEFKKKKKGMWANSIKKPKVYTSAEVKELYKAEGRVPYEVEQAISKYDTWVERTVNPNKIDSHIDAYTFKGKTEKPRFDRLVKELKAGRDTNPILIEGRINPSHAHQVKGATFDEPIDGYARLAAHKKLNKPIKVLMPMREKEGAWETTYRKVHDKYIIEAVDNDGNVIGRGRFVDKDGKIAYELGGIFYVEPEYRRKGVATAILEKAEEATGKELIDSYLKTPDGTALSESYRKKRRGAWAKKKELWEMDAMGEEYSKLSIDDIDRLAFGFAAKDIKTLKPSQLSIKWGDDYKNAKYQQKKSGLSPIGWAKTVNLKDPIDVILEDGKFKIDDGYHRYYAAKILGKPLNVDLVIKDKPHLAAVKKALAEGKPVPSEVLKVYGREIGGSWAQQIVYHGKWSNTETGKDFGGKHFGTKQAVKDRLGDIYIESPTGGSRARSGLGKPVVGKYIFDDSKIFGAEEPIAEGMMTPDREGNLRDMLKTYEALPSFRQKLKDAGYKGIAYINEIEHPGSVSYLIWDTSILKETKKPKPVKFPLTGVHRRREVRKPIFIGGAPFAWHESIKVGKVK